MLTSDRAPVRPVQRLDRPRTFRRCPPAGCLDSDPIAPPANAKASSHFREALPEYLRAAGGEDWGRVEPLLRAILARWADRWSDKKLRNITPEEIEAYFAEMARRGRGESELARERVLLRSFFRWAHRGGWTDRNPTGHLRSRKPGEPQDPCAWTPLEQHLLLEGAQGHFLRGETASATARKSRIPVRRRPLSVPPYLYPAVLVALRTGLRMADVLALRWRHVDLAASRIVLPAAERSGSRETCGAIETGYDQRTTPPREIDVPLAEDACLALDAIRRGLSSEPDSEVRVFAGLGLPLWRGRPDARPVGLAFRAVVKRAGIRDGDFETLRTTFLRNCAFAGVPSADAARLADFDGTEEALERIYALKDRFRRSEEPGAVRG